MTENAQQKHTPIIFQGKASEYFGIWIVNLMLSIVTLGIYSAWAKVRRKKYFYNNTLIDNVGFDYHAKPLSILKGRAIAVVFFALYAYGESSSPILAGVLLILFFLALPWLIVRGSLFNARNSSHRGLRFDFTGTTGQAAKVFIGLPLLMIPTLGLIMPYVAHQKNQFLANNHRFGLSQFDMKRVVKGFYKVYAIVFIVPFIGILAAVAIPAYQAYVNKAKAASAEPQATLHMPYVQAFAPLNAPVQMAANDVAAQDPLAAPAPEEIFVETSPAEIPTVERVYSENAPEAAPESAPATEPAAQTQAGEVESVPQEMTAEEEKAMEEMMKGQSKMQDWLTSPIGLLAMLGVMLLYALVIFGFAAYMQARIGNLVWNNTTLDKLSFKSTLRARDFLWLYLTNIIAIVCTFGLATPWAQIRMARYRASKLQIVGDVDFDQFVGDKKAEVKATGEEIAEMFDVDLSFG